MRFLRRKRPRTWAEAIEFTWEPQHRVLLTGEEIEVLAALCDTKAFEHLASPFGDTRRCPAWHALAQKLRDAQQENATVTPPRERS